MTTHRLSALGALAVVATLTVGAPALAVGVDHDEHGTFTPPDRQAVLVEATPTDTGAAPAWMLALVPVLGAAAGGLAGLQQRWSS